MVLVGGMLQMGTDNKHLGLFLLVYRKTPADSVFRKDRSNLYSADLAEFVEQSCSFY